MYLLAAGAAIAIAVIALIVLQNRSQAQVSQPPAVSTVITEGLTDRNVKGLRRRTGDGDGLLRF